MQSFKRSILCDLRVWLEWPAWFEKACELNILVFCFTEEELTNMQKELDKYGIAMPQFHKIGGILANELSVDEAARKIFHL